MRRAHAVKLDDFQESKILIGIKVPFYKNIKKCSYHSTLLYTSLFISFGVQAILFTILFQFTRLTLTKRCLFPQLPFLIKLFRNYLNMDKQRQYQNSLLSNISPSLQPETTNGFEVTSEDDLASLQTMLSDYSLSVDYSLELEQQKENFYPQPTQIHLINQPTLPNNQATHSVHPINQATQSVQPNNQHLRRSSLNPYQKSNHHKNRSVGSLSGMVCMFYFCSALHSVLCSMMVSLNLNTLTFISL